MNVLLGYIRRQTDHAKRRPHDPEFFQSIKGKLLMHEISAIELRCLFAMVVSVRKSGSKCSQEW